MAQRCALFLAGLSKKNMSVPTHYDDRKSRKILLESDRDLLAKSCQNVSNEGEIIKSFRFKSLRRRADSSSNLSISQLYDDRESRKMNQNRHLLPKSCQNVGWK